ncbi:MAG: TonB-dependent receptor [Gammaproteobacteria bacterium]
MQHQPAGIFLPLLAALGSAAVSAEAPPRLDEIVVTAGLREVAARTRPGGTTVLGRAVIEDAAVVHLEELLPLVPSLSWAGASSRPRYFLLRGVGELEQYQGAPNPSIGFLLDEIDLSGIGMTAALFDVEQVEVLRGPQGTRYGANALGGLIKLKTRDPAPVPSFEAEAGTGDDGLWSAGAAAGGPLAADSQSAWRAVLHRAASEGFRRNDFLDRSDTNGRDETTARLRLHLGGNGPWRAGLGLVHADFDNGYDAFAIDNSLHTLSDRPGRDAQRTDGAWLDLARALPDGGEWHSITTWADSDIEASFDGDWGNEAAWGANGPYDFFSRTLRGRRTLSQDLRFSSAPDRDWSWVAGAWLLRLEERNRLRDDGLYLDDAFVRTLASRYHATSVAAYGQVEWRPAPATAIAAGLRVEERDADYADTDGIAFEPRDRMWGGEFSITQRLGDAHTVWAMLSRGFRAGGFNVGTSVPPDRQQFDPEYLWSLETGWRATDDAGNKADMNLYYMRRKHQQVATSFQLDPQDPLTFLFLTDNAARGEAWGAEATATARPLSSLELGAMLTWMRSRYLDYRFGERDLDGREFAHAPEWKLALAATWRHPAGWMARLDLSGESGFHFDTSHDQRADSRMLVGLRAGYESRRWSVHAWVRNLLDERYPVRGFWFGNEPPDFPNRLYLRWGDPRQVGLTLRWVH